MDRWTRLGIEAYRTGNREQAQRFFHYALMERPNDIRTWLWLVEVADSDIEKQRGLTRVLALDPNHVLARRALDDVEARLGKNGHSPENPSDPQSSPPPHNSAVEVRSTPPFIENLARQPAGLRSEFLQAPGDRKSGGSRRIWIAAGIVLIILVGLLLQLGLSLHLFG